MSLHNTENGANSISDIYKCKIAKDCLYPALLWGMWAANQATNKTLDNKQTKAKRFFCKRHKQRQLVTPKVLSTLSFSYVTRILLQRLFLPLSA